VISAKSGVPPLSAVQLQTFGPDDFSKVLIVVPCLNEAANLPRLLDQFVSDTPGALVVVADGGSDDGSRAIVTARAAACGAVVLIENDARIQSAGVNAAVARFGDGCRWLVRVDAHCTYPSGFVESLLTAADAQSADSVVVPMITSGSGCFQQAVAAAQNSLLGTGGSAHRHVKSGSFVDHGHHALMSIDIFRRVGGYDPTFSHNEDSELDHRLGEAGARIWLEPLAAVTYSPRDTAKALYLQYRNYGGGRARTVGKHRLKLRLRQVLPLMVMPVVAAAMLGLAISPIESVGLLLVIPTLVWVGAAVGYGIVLGMRRRSLCAAAAGVAAVIMHFAWSLGYWQGLTRRRRSRMAL
jgi:succinoglycan biosynthesis protein ExoA